MPESSVTTIPTVLDLQGNVLGAATIDDASSMAMLPKVLNVPAPDQLIIAAIPKDLSDDELRSVVAKRLQSAKQSAADWAKVEEMLPDAVADETSAATVALPSGALVDPARASVGKLTELVNELTKGHTGKKGAYPRFGIVAPNTVLEIQLDAETAMTTSELAALAVNVVSGGQLRTLLRRCRAVPDRCNGHQKTRRNRRLGTGRGSQALATGSMGKGSTLRAFAPICRAESAY